MKLHKIATQHQNHSQAMAGFHPYGTAATLMTMPLAAVTYEPDPGYPWGTAAYRTLHPLWAADSGGAVAAADTGRHARVIPAGQA